MSGILTAIPGILASSGGGGGGGGLDTEIVTVGEFIFGVDILLIGYSPAISGSAINDGKFTPKGGATISGIYFDAVAGVLSFTLEGVHTNAGWTTMTIGSRSYSRTAATFSNSFDTSWQWFGSVNPFSGVGTNTTVVFT